MKTISYELAEKLNKLGVKRHSCIGFPKEDIHVYTLDEILKMLPANIKEKTICGKPGTVPYVLSLIKSNFYCASYDCLGGCENCNISELACITFSNKENAAEAAGELLAWCIEKGHVKPEGLCRKILSLLKEGDL